MAVPGEFWRIATLLPIGEALKEPLPLAILSL